MKWYNLCFGSIRRRFDSCHPDQCESTTDLEVGVRISSGSLGSRVVVMVATPGLISRVWGNWKPACFGYRSAKAECGFESRHSDCELRKAVRRGFSQSWVRVPHNSPNAQVPEWLMGRPAKPLFVGSIPTLRSGGNAAVELGVTEGETSHSVVVKLVDTPGCYPGAHCGVGVRSLSTEPMVLRC